MTRLRKIYVFVVLGALGGLLGAALHQWLLLDILARPLEPYQRHVANGVLGLLVGASIGFSPRFSDGLGHYSVGRAARDGLIGAVLGGVGGAGAVLVGEVLHSHLGGHFSGRATAFGVLGLTVGIAEGVEGGARWWRGIVGGLVGGVVAGVLLEVFLERPKTYSDSGIIALILLGLSISLFVSLFVNVLSEAWLEGLPGSKITGQVYQLSKFHEPNQAILGSDKAGSVFIWIPGATARHAAITLTADGAILRHIAQDRETRVNGNPVSGRLLCDRDVIEIGSARLQYRERRSGTSLPLPVDSVKPGSASSRIKVLTKTA